jgi:hypothetical protein
MTQIRNLKQNGFWSLDIGVYLGIGFCDLEFWMLSILRYT